MKLLEGNVFNRVCQSFFLGRGAVQGPGSSSVQGAWTCSNLFTMWAILLASGQLGFDENTFLLINKSFYLTL